MRSTPPMAKALTVLCLFFSFCVQAQISGTKNIPGDYATLAAAITALNAQGVGTGGVTLNLLSGNPQTAPAGGYVVGNTGSLVLSTTSASKTVTIQGNGNTITSPTQTSGNINDGIFKIIGADWITITGFTLQENASNTNTVEASNNMTEWGIALLYESATNGAQNCTVQNNTISLDRNWYRSVGVYSNSCHAASTPDVSASATGSTGGNHSLKIYSNAISDVNVGVFVLGPTAAADMNTGLDIGGSALTANTISDFGQSQYLSSTYTVAGIIASQNLGVNISYNNITSSSGVVTSTSLRGIFLPAGSAVSGSHTHTISYNTISLTPGVSGNAIEGIYTEGNAISGSATLNITNNNFTAMTATAQTTGHVRVIRNSGPATNINISNNTFTNLTSNTSGNFYFITNDIVLPSGAAYTISNNSIITGFTKTIAGGIVGAYLSTNTSSSTSAVETFSGNNFSNITVTSGTALYLVQMRARNMSQTTGKNVMNNTFANIIGGTDSMSILEVSFLSNTNKNVSGNSIHGITGQGDIALITSSGNLDCYSNTLYDVTSAGASSIVEGITVTAGTSPDIFKNRISDLESNNGGFVYGIKVDGGSCCSNFNVYNNLISDLRAPTSSGSTEFVRGIYSTVSNTTTNLNFYYNTVYLNATSSGTNFSTACIYTLANSTSTTSALDLRNNILVNLSTPKGTGRTIVLRRATTPLENYASTSNNNLFYAGTPGTNRLIMYYGSIPVQTLDAFKTLVSPRESASVTENPSFIATDVTVPGFLHINTTNGTQIESSGAVITGFTDDADGVTRNASTPDIGADEGDFTTELTWTGNTSSDWNTPGNWTPSGIPSTTSFVMIPAAGVSNEPSLNNVSSVNNLNVAAGRTLTLNEDLTVAGIVSLGGMVILGNNDLSAASCTGSSTTSYIQTNGSGTLKLPVSSTAMIFPVGNSSYNPLTLTNTGTADNFSVRVADDMLTNGNSGTTITQSPVAKRCWFVTEDVAGGSNATMTLQWNSADNINSFDMSHVYVVHHNGTSWEDYLGGSQPYQAPAPTSLGSSNYLISATGITSFSPFGVASDGGFPLNISLADISAENFANKISVRWVNATEVVGDGMELERSADGHTFNSVYAVAAKGKNNASYVFDDTHPINGINYYRLKLLHIDGSVQYSKTVTALFQKNDQGFFFYPNPANGVVYVQSKTAGQLIISSAMGQVLKRVTLQPGMQSVGIADLAPGLYVLRVEAEHEVVNRRLMVD